ncbi:PulJ/GspJ family protein [Prosthecodimorpha hirschii]|uniref:PulJ/GspJ family protein n=1 Tax=Prosthecodimorpha hirschii TaxID=665126 RepID=UPI0015E4873C|nr:prepilin-type N-terminal cleavage/methylation domain-containing protein [Prosthecomicrobium hirschii]
MNPRAGFTLLEVLVGLAIASLVLLTAFRLFETVPRLAIRSDAALERMTALFEFHERIVALAAAHVDDARRTDAAFEPDRWRSAALANAAGALPGARPFEIGRDSNGVFLDYPVHDRTERRHYRFAEIAFAYQGPARPGTWLDTWPKGLPKPEGVRLRVTVEAGDRPYEFVLKLLGRRPAVCPLLPDDQNCQR